MKSKQYAKRLLSLIIASVMIVTMLPVSVLAAGVDDAMIEDQAETIVEEAVDVSGEVVEEAAEVPDIENSEDAAIVEGAVDELEEADPEELTGYTETLSFTAQGVPSGSKMHFDAQLTGLSVSVVVPAKRAAKGSVMTADIVDVSAYEDAVAKKNYGKSIAGLYGLELHFYDKKGKPIKHINTSNITVTVDGFEASSYFIGRIDNKVKKIQRGTEPTFTFTEKKAYTYVIAGLEDDGLVRAFGEVDGDGNKRFNLNDENVNIEVVAPEDAFADGVAMEANDVTSGTALDAEGGDDALVGASADEIIAAYNISFYNEDGAEQQPSKAVTVTINVPLDMTKSYKLIHIADDGTSNEVEGAKFTENGVEFTAKSFSEYVIEWTDAEENPCSATIHWGTAGDNGFEELADPVTIDSTASTVELQVIIDAEKYYFTGAEYKVTQDAVESENLTSTVLRKVDGEWKVTLETSGTIPVANGSHIYVHYAEYGEGGYTPPQEPDDDVLAPETEKNVERNDDGTYTITLDITGKAEHTVTKKAANVIIVMDRTSSMHYDMSDGTERMVAARAALNTLISTLNPGTGDDENLVYMQIVSFYNKGDYDTDLAWTTSRTAMENYATNVDYVTGSLGNGTPWEVGLLGGKDSVIQAKADNTMKNNETYVLFITDGCPNGYWRTRQGRREYYSTGSPSYNATAYNAAVPNANWLGENSHFYGIFCGQQSDYQYLNNLITGAHGDDVIYGDSVTGMQSAFQGIADTIVKNLGAGGVTVDDGVPTLSNVSASVSSGDAGGFKYFKKEPDASEFSTWEQAPGATYSKTNGVTWDLSAAGELVNNAIYRLQFTVWPSQEAYDLISDLNNDLRQYDDLSDEEKAAVQGSKEEGYTLLTNTHLYTTFTDLKGKTYQVTNDASPEAMPLPTTKIKVVKYWDNDLDDREAVRNAKIIITKDNDEYFRVDLGDPQQVPGYEHRWVQKPTKEIYISMGQLILDESTDKINVISEGHEYSVMEDDNYSHYWWLTAEVYHPMMVNGEPTVLVEVKAEDIPDSLSELANNMHAVDDEKDYYKFQGNLYVAREAGTNILEATNDRRSNLNFTKTVTGENPPDDYFTYTVTVTDRRNEDVWFSIFDAPEGGAVVKDASLVTDATPQDGNTGYWHFESGSTATIKIKAGWNVRFINLPNGTEYEIVEEESSMEPGWVFTKAESSTASDYEATPAVIAGSTATGTIDKANSQYVVKYTNEYLGVFYVYHSSNCSVERFPMAVNGVKVTGFNITEKTASGTLYGGYYNNYAGKSSTFDATTLDYSGENSPTDTGGTAYNYAYIKQCNRKAWDDATAYTTSGKAMNPEANKVYYLKEVPTAYLLPYTHYTYNKGTKLLCNMWYISAIDDLHYGETGFFVETFDAAGKKTTVKIVTTLTITNSNGGATVTLSPKSVFGNKGGTVGGVVQGVQAGYLTYWDAKEAGLIVENTESVFTPFWYTPDQIYVCGTTTRTISFNNTKVGAGGMRITDATNETPLPDLTTE